VSVEDAGVGSMLEVIDKEAAEALLLAWRYGYVPASILGGPQNPSGYSTTRLEFEEAKREQKPMPIVYLRMRCNAVASLGE
jgi:hypothetical protein